MVIKIAAGVMIGFLFLGLFVLLIFCISALIVRGQDKAEKPIHHRIRPEADNYQRMQELKNKAKDAHPEHWGRRNRE